MKKFIDVEGALLGEKDKEKVRRFTISAFLRYKYVCSLCRAKRTVKPLPVLRNRQKTKNPKRAKEVAISLGGLVVGDCRPEPAGLLALITDYLNHVLICPTAQKEA